MSDSAFRIGIIQMACGDDTAENLSRGAAHCVAAAKEGAQVILLPELFRSRYFCQKEDAELFDLAEPVPGPTTQELAKVAKAHNVVIVAPVFERRAPGLYHNSAMVIDADGEPCGLYRKMHIPDDPLYYEKFYFTPGDLGYRAFKTRHATVGVLICWDQWYPEAARLTALRGAEVLLYPTAIGWHPKEKAEQGERQYTGWKTIQRGHAVANGVFVAVANRTGHEGDPGGGLEFWGASFVSDPFGAILKEASHDREEILVTECDRKLMEMTRRYWPFLRDRRIDSYGPITERYLD